jgi:V8-like Glu-specific endopeptidase
MYEIHTRTSLPYAAICYLTVTFPDGASIRGSGVLVGPNDVLTAMHMVYWADHGGYATSIQVTPGADTSPGLLAPYGTHTNWSSINTRVPNWDIDGDSLLSGDEAQYDMALIGLGTPVGNSAGWLPVLGTALDFQGMVAGYPALGSGLMAQNVFADASSSWGVYEVEYGLGPGASGGPLLHTANGQTYVAGVLSSGTLDLSFSSYAGIFGAGTLEWLNTVRAANDGYGGSLYDDMLQGTSAGERIAGQGGYDRLAGNGGNDTLDGGAGVDTAVFSGERAGYTLTLSAGGAGTVADRTAGRDGTDTLAGIERLEFGDVVVALDLNGAAGTVARTVGAVFGREAVANRDFIGIGLAFMDAGMNELDLTQLALDARLGPGASPHSLVDVLYTNVIGFAPDAATQAHYVGLLASGQFTTSTLGVLAARTSVNEANINLAGLASTGIEYFPYIV